MITIINPIERPSFMMLCQFHQFDEIHQIHQFQQFDKVIRSNEFKFGIWIRLKWIMVEYWQSPTKDKCHQVIHFINLMNEIKVINFIRLIMFIKYFDQSNRETQLLSYIWGLTISEARIVILLLFWVGGGWMVGCLDGWWIAWLWIVHK